MTTTKSAITMTRTALGYYLKIDERTEIKLNENDFKDLLEQTLWGIGLSAQKTDEDKLNWLKEVEGFLATRKVSGN